MTPQQTKMALVAATVVALMGGLYAINHSVTSGQEAKDAAARELADADIRQGRLGVSGRNGSGDDDSASDKNSGKNGKSGNGGRSGSSDAGLASIVDDMTSSVMPIESEAETRDREKYEKAMANQFKYRELDPEKIKPAELAPALETTSKKYEIPDNLLAAMMYVETGGTHRDGDHSMEAGYGVMNLRENNTVDTAAEAASLIGKTKEDVFYNQKDNIEAAGALLRSYYDDAKASGLSEKEAWYAAVSQYSGRPDPELAAALADETAGFMMKGFELHLSDGGGDLIVPPNSNPVFFPKNWELVGMNPPGTSGGQQANSGSTPPNGQGSGSGSAAGGATVTP